MGFLAQLIGLGMTVAGLFFLGRNIRFTSYYSNFWWGGMGAGLSVLLLISGVLMIILGPRQGRAFGWFPIALCIILIFLTSRVTLAPTNLWEFVLAFGCLTAGLKLTLTSKLD